MCRKPDWVKPANHQRQSQQQVRLQQIFPALRRNSIKWCRPQVTPDMQRGGRAFFAHKLNLKMVRVRSASESGTALLVERERGRVEPKSQLG